jgi:hypothetical protein
MSSQRKAFAGNYNGWPRGTTNWRRTSSGRNPTKRAPREPRWVDEDR